MCIRVHAITLRCKRGLTLAAGSALLAALSANPARAMAPGSVEIDLPGHVEVDGSYVHLGEVAALRTPDLLLLRRLMALPLGRAPQPGEPVFLGREQLARWIRLQTGLGAERVRWTGAPTIALSIARQDVSAQEFSRIAQTALQDWLQQRSQRAQVQVAELPHSITLPRGVVSLQVRPLIESAPRKRMTVWVDAYLDGNLRRSVPVSFAVSAWVQAPVIRQSAPMGASIALSDTIMREVDLTVWPNAIEGNDVRETLQDQALRLRRPVRVGDVLTLALVEPVPTVTRGEWVRLQTNEGFVSLESRAEALQDGHAGQIVNVKMANARSSLTARVRGPGLVEVQQ